MESRVNDTQLSVHTVTGGPLDVNTYVVGAEGGSSCIVIDPGAEFQRVKAAVGDRRVEAVLLTHAHFDHMLYAAPWIDTGAKLYVHSLDAPALQDEALNLCSMIRVSLALPSADRLLADGDVIELAGVTMRVLHTPGHTPGSVCYLSGHTLFSGDTMFYQSYGRVDLPGGSARQMFDSLKRLGDLEESTLVYPGHGMKTKIAWERGMYR